MIPLFDSLTHPTQTGKWLNGKKLDSSFETLSKDLSNNGYCGACAVGLDGCENYNHLDFIKSCEKFKLVGIAGFSPFVINLREELEYIKHLGFKGIKIHPRISKIDMNESFGLLSKVLQICYELNLVVYLCTYNFTKSTNSQTYDQYYILLKLIKSCPKVKLVLVHGGVIEILKYMELVRHNDNILLDLSLTIMKYEGSSIDFDIKFLFKSFDQRICIGSDHPEYSLSKLRKRVEFFSYNTPQYKLENIYYKNIKFFLNI